MADADSPVDAEFWTKKVGPLPVWAWVGAIGGGIGYYFLRANRAATASTSASVAGSSDTGFGTTSPGVGGQSATSGQDDTVTVSPRPQDNNAWSMKAQNLLVALGFDPGTVATALSNYLGGNALTAQQTAIVSEALRSAGPTPEPVPPAAPPVPETPAQAPLEQGVFGVGYGPLTKEFWTAHTQDDAMTAISGDRYSWLPGAAAVKAAQVSGQTTYYQPAPGVFAPTTGFTAAQWQNTPIFVKA